MYSAFSRMHMQKTWDAILNAPLTLDDVLLGEWVWSASKSFLSGSAVLIVAALLGLVPSPLAIAVIPLIFLTGLAFAGLGLIMTALSPSYDFFMYYFTLCVTPMMLLCGVFFPVHELPAPAQLLAQALPLTHAVALARPLVNGTVPPTWLLHIAVLAAYAAGSAYIALALTRRRLLQ
jgi:lipooligosaccharide transport system permease protein